MGKGGWKMMKAGYQKVVQLLTDHISGQNLLSLYLCKINLEIVTINVKNTENT